MITYLITVWRQRINCITPYLRSVTLVFGLFKKSMHRHGCIVQSDGLSTIPLWYRGRQIENQIASRLYPQSLVSSVIQQHQCFIRIPNVMECHCLQSALSVNNENHLCLLSYGLPFLCTQYEHMSMIIHEMKTPSLTLSYRERFFSCCW